MKPKIRRILHRLFFAAVAVVTLVALFYAEEDWRGACAWDNLRRELAARGESLDPKDFIPPPVPDCQNLAMAPLFVRAFRYKVDPATAQLTFNSTHGWWDDETCKQLQAMPSLPSRGNWTTGHHLDFVPLQQYYHGRKDFPHSSESQSPAEEVALALTRYQPLLDELALALDERPRCRFPINYGQRPLWNLTLPHYSLIQGLTAALRQHSLTELARSRTTDALRDIEEMLALRRATAYDPNLISALVDSTDLFQLLQPVWEGLAARQWSSGELDRLRDGLRGIDVLSGYLRGIRGGERAMFLGLTMGDLQSLGPTAAREFAKTIQRMSGNEDPTSSWYWLYLLYLPQGWYEQNTALVCRIDQQCLIDPVDLANHRISLTAAKSLDETLQKLLVGPYSFLAKTFLSPFGSIILKFAQTQAFVDQAIAACALEKYYLNHHVYPDRLAALVPAYLDRVPDDLIDGAPLRYRLTSDGRYQLYSVGWDGKDDGGTVEWPADRKWWGDSTQPSPFPNPVKDRGDWVWQYAPAEPPDPPANRSRLE